MIYQVFILILTLVVVYFIVFKKRTNLPPGPTFGLPILGHLPFLGNLPCKTFIQWSKRYGPMILVQLGSYPAIIINDYQLIRKAFNMSSFAGRPCMRFIDEVTKKGLLFSDGLIATEQRKFILRIFKDFGYGTHSMESRILDQIPSLLKVFEDHLTKPMHVKHSFNLYVMDVLWRIIAGDDLTDKAGEGYQQLALIASSSLDMSTIIRKLAVYIKFIPEWFPEFSGFNEKVRGMSQIRRYMNSLIQRHKITKVKGQPRDVIDAYLDEVEMTLDPTSSFFAANENITYTIQDLFMAGVDSTGTNLEWILFYLAKYTNVQKKLQNEIDLVLGNKSLLSSDDRLKLPYTQAVVQEVLRISSTGALSLFHCALEDTEFNGFSIPKGMAIVGNLYAVHHDKDIWGDPEAFRPERFIDNKGNIFGVEKIMPFSWGKRSCPAESLVRLQLFLYTVSIFQRFSVKPVGELPSEEGIFGIVISVHPFQIQVKRR